jgi:hypothetical protein
MRELNSYFRAARMKQFLRESVNRIEHDALLDLSMQIAAITTCSLSAFMYGYGIQREPASNDLAPTFSDRHIPASIKHVVVFNAMQRLLTRLALILVLLAGLRVHAREKKAMR